jgi:hypothetical protein
MPNKLLLILLVGLLTLTACSAKGQIFHGYSFNDIENFSNKITHISNKNDMLKTLGTPTFIYDNDYVYLNEVFAARPVYGKTLVTVNILIISIEQDKIINIQYDTIECKTKHIFDHDNTVMNDKEINIFKEILNNIGRFK